MLPLHSNHQIGGEKYTSAPIHSVKNWSLMVGNFWFLNLSKETLQTYTYVKDYANKQFFLM